MGKSASVYTMKVVLTHAPRYLLYTGGVSRTLQALGDQTLPQLHVGILAAFGHEGNGDYQFCRRVNGSAVSYVDADRPRVSIESLGLRKGEKLRYDYDVDFYDPEYSDEWMHEIRVVSIKLEPISGQYPKLVERVGNLHRPPSDYGGAEQESENS